MVCGQSLLNLFGAILPAEALQGRQGRQLKSG